MIGAVFTGLAALLTGTGSLVSGLGKRASADLEATRARTQTLQAELNAATALAQVTRNWWVDLALYVDRLRHRLVAHGEDSDDPPPPPWLAGGAP